MVKFLDLGKQYQSIKYEVDEAINQCIEKSQFIGGEPVKRFEADFASFLDIKHCVGVGNGTDALEISIESLELPSNSEILVPANSFIATAEAVTRSGHKVIFVDIDPSKYCIDVNHARRLITPNTKAIIMVHLYGQPCDIDNVNLLAREFDLKVIEDCAQAHGAKYKNKAVGNFGDISAFSFYPGKNLGAYGDGGAIVTNNSELALKSKMIANHGRLEKFHHLIEGRNSRLDSIQASILSIKLKYLNDWIACRNKIAKFYIKELKFLNEKLQLPLIEENTYHAFHLFVVKLNERDKLRNFLKQRDIPTGIHYPYSLPELKAYSNLNQAIKTPIANKSAHKILSIPMGEHLSESDTQKIVESIKLFFKDY